MGKQHQTKLVRHGMYVTGVDVELVFTDDGWSPYLTVDDAKRLDDVRESVRRRDLDRGSRYGRVYILTPVASLTGSRDHVTP